MLPLHLLEMDLYLIVKSSFDLDLTNQSLVLDFIADEKPDVIINAAAKVGGILANDNIL